jgi:thymidylate kinase
MLTAATKHLTIAIEGLDGTGKSTVARLLAHRIGAALYTTPPPEFTAIREVLDATECLTARFFYYLSSVCYAAADALKVRDASHVVFDRYAFSTMACHRALGVNIDVELNTLGIPNPDFTFLLTITSEEERLRRIRARGLTSKSDVLVEALELRTKMLKEFRRFGLQEIDTTNVTAEQVVDTIMLKTNLDQPNC